MQLYIGNKNYSSWSMRPWLLMTQAGIAFERACCCASTASTPSRAFKTRRCSRSRRPAACRCSSTTASRSGTRWRSPNTSPSASRASSSGRATRRPRARARSLCAEMHSGFGALRNALPDEHRGVAARVGARCCAEQPDVARRPAPHRSRCGATRSRRSGGPFLFGALQRSPTPTSRRCARASGPTRCRCRRTVARLRRARAGAAGACRPGATTRSPSTTSSMDEPYRSVALSAGAARRLAPMKTLSSSAARCATRCSGCRCSDRDWVVVGADARARCSPPATCRSARTSRCSCIPRRTRSTRSRAPSARPRPATTASCSTPRPT